jgi:hypothetical protein
MRKTISKTFCIYTLLSVFLLVFVVLALYFRNEATDQATTNHQNQTSEKYEAQTSNTQAIAYPLDSNLMITTKLPILANSLVVIDDNPFYTDSVDTLNQVIASFIFTSPNNEKLNSKPINVANNYLTVYQNPNFTNFFGLSNAEETRAKVDSLLKAKTDLDCDKHVVGQKVFAKVVKTKDGVYSGCVTGAFSPQVPDYGLSISTNLVNKRDEEVYLMTGFYQVIDEKYIDFTNREVRDADEAIKARDQAIKSLPNDLSRLIEDYIDFVKNIQTTVSERSTT